MKKLSKLILQIAALSLTLSFLMPQSAEAAAAKADQGLKIRYVNFKSCIENSKLGKQEQANFDSLKKQMETMLSEKDKTLSDLAEKLEDPDYLDSLSPEAETEIKRKFRTLSQEMTQQQNQYLQTLQQTNFKVLEKLDHAITEACKILAQKNGYNSINNDEATFYYDKDLDISQEVVAIMDELFDKEAKEAKNKPVQ
ncbi:MAG: OmpH family outer membrane protein [Parachlamydiaceae bacterium]|nr:MAG: OmpH family outer membrane protein [Parachlamydiaceae bacterium]